MELAGEFEPLSPSSPLIPFIDLLILGITVMDLRRECRNGTLQQKQIRNATARRNKEGNARAQSDTI